MNLKSIETTPNPNSMKLNLTEDLGAAVTYSAENKALGPGIVQRLLEIEGLNSVFVCCDFLTLNKDARFDWKSILAEAAAIFGQAEMDELSEMEVQRDAAEKEGQVHVTVQTFRGIPIQVKATDASGENRVSLGERFNEIAEKIQEETQANYLAERYWADYGVRYGDREEVANDVAAELRGRFDEAALEQAKAKSLGQETVVQPNLETLRGWLADDSWQRRLVAVEELSHHEEALPELIQALRDSNPHVRRLAAAALGATGSPVAVDPLCDVLLNDDSVGVRRTAGDALSDLGDVSAQPAVCRALGDPNKLVRWRAARFLFDLGTADAIPFLEQAANDPHFEVRLEVQAAIQRLKEGTTGLGPVWKRIVDQL